MDLSKYDLTDVERTFVEMPHPITLKLWEDEDERYYVASIPLLKGCMSDGETIKEALENIMDAKICWISAALELKDNIPEPKNTKPILELLGKYSDEEIHEMNQSYEKMGKLIRDFNKKHENVVFLHTDK